VPRDTLAQISADAPQQVALLEELGLVVGGNELSFELEPSLGGPLGRSGAPVDPMERYSALVIDRIGNALFDELSSAKSPLYEPDGAPKDLWPRDRHPLGAPAGEGRRTCR
jgi:hypothetical protein